MIPWLRRWRRPSLLAKIFLIHAAVLCLAAIAVPVATKAVLESRATFYEHRVLMDRARLVAEALVAAPDGVIHLPPGRYSREGDSGEFGFAVIDPAGHVLFSSTAFATGLLASLPHGPEPLFSTVVSDAKRYGTVSFPVTVQGHALWVQQGWDTSQDDVIFDDLVQSFLGNALALSVPLLGLLLVADMVIVGRFFRPVRQVSQHVADLQAAEGAARFPIDDLPVEILPLGHAFNDALDKVERSAQLQKEFTADAAHELRTPLAVLNARLQSLPPGPDRDVLLSDATRMARIVGQLLDMARLEEKAATAEETDLLGVCRDVVGALAPEAIAAGRSLGLTEPDDASVIWVTAREQDVWHMLRNLVENAIRHTHPGTVIDVRLDPDGTLIVQDDGPGIPLESQPHIFQRFWRQRRNTGNGAGLGMAIVRRVVESNGGTITLQSAPGEGTAFTIRLPCSR